MDKITPILCVFALIGLSTCMIMTENKNAKTSNNQQNCQTETIAASDYCLVIHGGAGRISKKNLPDSLEMEYHDKLREALQKGIQMLEGGESAVDVVEKVVAILEDSPLFNAGRGSVFSNSGKNTMDASIMDGRDLSCGAVAGLSNIKNPISAARLVKDSTKHVFLYGEDCKEFCINQGMTIMADEYFKTEKRWNQYMRALKKDKISLDHDGSHGGLNEVDGDGKMGTVGCVALDKFGNLAAGTSTGGLTNKKYGRIGDSPIIGAGNYANNESCAVSCTGIGEAFIRSTTASDISSRLLYGNESLQKACTSSLGKVISMGGRGGIIAIDAKGEIVMVFNTKGMYRGYATSTGELETSIW